MKDVEKLRAQIGDAQTKITNLRRAFLTDAEITARVDAFMGQQRALVARLYSLADGLASPGATGSGIVWPMANDLIKNRPELGFALSMCSNETSFRAEIMKRALAKAKSGHQAHGEDRNDEIAQLEHEIYDLSVKEEAAVTSLEHEGTYVVRRSDANPYAVLGLPITS